MPRTRPPAAFAAPDPATFVDPRKDRVLAEYLDEVLKWHGYLRFLGLPHLHDNPDVPLDRMFVEPGLTVAWMRPENWPAKPPPFEPLERTLRQHPRLVLLGDPGSGKSTVINFVAWQLARRDPSSWWGWLFGEPHRRLLPLPLILRELPLGADLNWDKLLTTFCRHPMTRPLADRVGPALDAALARGQAFVMLDGLDEIGSLPVRAALRDAVLEGMDRYPGCRWLMTSRIVGYDDVPFHRVVEPSETDFEGRPTESDFATLRYVAPFSDSQIERFVTNWFSQRDVVTQRADATAADLLPAIFKSKETHDLARIPNLLTLIALIYRVEAWLPNGRSKLYEKIAQAYLESIDRVRKIREVAYDGDDLRSWLARVGFEMQLRRADQREKRNNADDATLVASTAEVRQWLGEGMRESGRAADDRTVDELISFLGRRSGLLLPRGVDEHGAPQFAFMHLSFLEFFAACYLRDQLLSADWPDDAREETRPDALRAAATTAVWKEPFIYLFEMLERQRGWPKKLLELLYGENVNTIEPGNTDQQHLVRLLGQVAVDRHSGLPEPLREQAEQVCLNWEVVVQRPDGNPIWNQQIASVVGVMLAYAEPDRASRLVESLAERWRTAGITQWAFFDSPFSDLGVLLELERLTGLDLTRTGVTDLSPLVGLAGLQKLWLNQTSVTDLSPLAGLTGLQKLWLNQTSVTDLSPLAGLTGLQGLWLNQTPVTDLSPLAGLTGLQGLNLTQTSVTDLSPLAGLTGLQKLWLNQTPVTDLSPLAGLTGLQGLWLNQTSVTDLSPLAGLTGLQGLWLNQTSVTDLSPLAGLTGLRELRLTQTSVTDLSPLAGLTGLQELYLTQTSVTDLSPLAGLTGLQELYLTQTSVTDLSPLAGQTGLNWLHLTQTSVTDLSPLAGLSRLRGLFLTQTSVTDAEVRRFEANHPRTHVIR